MIPPRQRAPKRSRDPARRPLAALPLPLFLIQPALARIVRHIATLRSEVFDRLGEYRSKHFLIDPTDMPIVLLLQPDRVAPRLRAFRRRDMPAFDARIAGSLRTLLDMVEGRLDGDSLMFSRELAIEGDIGAVVSLRNALDDIDGDVIEDAAAAYGRVGRVVLMGLRTVRSFLDEGSPVTVDGRTPARIAD